MDDPNADLIGTTYSGPGGYQYVVQHSAEWSPQYLYVESINHPDTVLPIRTVVGAKLLRESIR